MRSTGMTGFIHSGQVAIVKIESFPFTRCRTITAHVTRVARDAIPEPDANQIEGDPAKTTAGAGFAAAQRTQNLVFPVTLAPDGDTITIDGMPAPLTYGRSSPKSRYAATAFSNTSFSRSSKRRRAR
jgi:hemolysin D